MEGASSARVASIAWHSARLDMYREPETRTIGPEELDELVELSELDELEELHIKCLLCDT